MSVVCVQYCTVMHWIVRIISHCIILYDVTLLFTTKCNSFWWQPFLLLFKVALLLVMVFDQLVTILLLLVLRGFAAGSRSFFRQDNFAFLYVTTVRIFSPEGTLMDLISKTWECCSSLFISSSSSPGNFIFRLHQMASSVAPKCKSFSHMHETAGSTAVTHTHSFIRTFFLI